MRKYRLYSMFLLLLLCGYAMPGGLSKRAIKEVEKTFEVEDFDLQPILLPEKENEELPTKITGENLYKVYKDNELLGYTFFDQAPSKTASFDYLVVFDTGLKVINTKVVVYREEYGGEIGSKRWLKQFLGKSPGDHMSTQTNIDVISGATISVNSMTKAMDNLLITLGILEEKGHF